MRKKLKDYFKSSKQRVSFTTDTWTSPNNFNYMCVPVHYVDQNWKLQKRIILFCQVKGHIGTAIGKMLEKCLLYWGLEDVFSVTLDNVSANTLAIDYLKQTMIGWTGAIERTEYLHVRCAAHILALVIKDAVRLYKKSIARIRSVVRHVIGSPARWEMFKHCCALEKIDCKKGMILDIKTRWNSTFLMLEAADKYERAFKRLEKYDRDYKKKYIFEEVQTDALPSHDDLLVLAISMEELPFSSSSSSDSEMKVETDPKSKKKMKKKETASSPCSLC